MYLRALTQGLSKIFLLPRLSIPIMLTLSLTLGAVLTVVAMVSNLMLKPLPDVKAEQDLYSLTFNYRISEQVEIPALGDQEIAAMADYFKQWGELSRMSFGKGEAEIAQQIYAVTELNASSNYPTNVLNQPLILGELPNSENLIDRVWISEHLWLVAFDKSPNVLGKTVKLKGKDYVVQGVLKQHFSLKQAGTFNPQQVWHFYSLQNISAKTNVSSYSDQIAYRLKERLINEQDVSDFLAQYYKANPKDQFMANAFKSFQQDFSFIGYREEIMDGEGVVLWSLLLTVSVLLIMACLNLINLYLAHYQQRRAEWATHVSLGGTLQTIRRLIFIENFPAVLFATVFGLLAAAWTIRYLPFIFAGNINLVAIVELDFTTLVYAFLLSILINFAFTFVATKPFTTEGLLASLQSTNKGVSDNSANGIAKFLFVGQVSFAVVILTGCAMLAKVSYQELNRDFGYSAGNTLMAQITLNEPPRPSGPIPAQSEEERFAKLQKQRALRESLKKEVVSFSPEITPLDSSNEPFGLTFSRLSILDLEDNTSITYGDSSIAPDYIDAFGIELLEGRNVTQQEFEQNLPVAMVNQAMAEVIKKKDGVDSVIGHYFSDKEIVGVIGNTISYMGGNKVMPYFFTTGSDFFGTIVFMMQAPAGYKFDKGAIRQLLLNASDEIKDVKTKTALEQRDEVFYDQTIQYRFIIMLSALTLLLAVLGSIGMAKNFAEMKRFEMAVRMSTGASRGNLLALSLMSFRGLISAASAVAIAFTAASYLLVREHLQKIPEISWSVTGMFLSLLLISIFISIVLVIWKIVNQDPMRVLREE